MKIVVLLLSCFALSVAQDDADFDMFGIVDDTFKTHLNSMVDMIEAHVLTEDGTAFRPAILAMMSLMEPQICPLESNQCDSDENWLFGCSCRSGFRALGECKAKPCQLYRHFKENGPAAFTQFLNSNSFEEMYFTVVDYLVYPISKALCDCPGMIDASVSCVRRYDGSLFEIVELPRTKFDDVVKEIDWKSLKLVLHGMIEAGCGEKNGKDCLEVFSDTYVLMGTIMDNSFNGKDVCLSLIRAEDEFMRYIAGFGSFEEEGSIKSFVDSLMDAYINMERKFMCDSRCASEMSDTFYSCCTKHAMDVLSSKPMKKGYTKLFKNMWNLFSETKAPKLTNAVKKYFEMMDIDSFCGDQTDVYGVKNAECEALGA